GLHQARAYLRRSKSVDRTSFDTCLLRGVIQWKRHIRNTPADGDPTSDGESCLRHRWFRRPDCRALEWKVPERCHKRSDTCFLPRCLQADAATGRTWVNKKE